MNSQRFDLLFNELKDEHNKEVNQLKEELIQYKIKVKHLESELKSLNQRLNDSVDKQWLSVTTQTEEDIYGSQTNLINSCDQSFEELDGRKAGRRPTRKATRKLIVNHFEPDYCLPINSKDNEVNKPEICLNKRLRSGSHPNLSKSEDNKQKVRVIGRKRNSVWKHFQDLGQSVNEQFRRAKCLYCDQELHTSKLYLMVKHLALNCDLCPKHISNECLDKLESNSESKRVTTCVNEHKMSNRRTRLRLNVYRRAGVWVHFEDLGPSEFGSYRKAKCIHCSTLFRTSKLPQMSRHLAKECALCPQEVILQFRNMFSIGETSDHFKGYANNELNIKEENKTISSRKRTKVWQHFKDLGKGNSGSFRKTECLYCNQLFLSSRLSAMTRHLAKNCVLCPKEVKNEYQNQDNKYSAKRLEEGLEDNSYDLDNHRNALL